MQEKWQYEAVVVIIQLHPLNPLPDRIKIWVIAHKSQFQVSRIVSNRGAVCFQSYFTLENT
jgi:hypothetical protein